MLDRKGSLVESKGWSIIMRSCNVVENDKNVVKVRNLHRHHELPILRCHELHRSVKKTIKHEGKPAIQIMSRVIFFSESNAMLSQAIDFFLTKKLCTTQTKRRNEVKETILLVLMVTSRE